ncbi:MAG: rhomboid family intramembrane serine protease [Flavobacteriales bacterium]|nr:MAG: rhomboid family intramembrane serine protease [Flavobacteriales bacterium]
MLEDLKRQWRSGGMVIRLILVNAAVFLLLRLVDLPFWAVRREGPDILGWLWSTSNLRDLLHRPWTVVTYMFVHWDFLHLFFNLMLLWFMGRIFEDLLGGRRVLGNYLLGGLSGLALYVAGYNILPVFADLAPISTIHGASAAVMAVLVGIAAYRPDLEVHLLLFGAVRLKWVALVLVLIDLVSVRSSGNSGGHLAHIGGAIYGYAASMQLRKGNDWSLSFVNALDRLFSLVRRKKGPRMRVTRPAAARGRSDADYNQARRDDQARIDAILDKISRSGYDSLTKEEKATLFKAGGS